MKVLTIPTEEEFESLPPALKRKFFSNVERLRMRLAQSDHHHGLISPSSFSPRPRLHFRFRSSPADKISRKQRGYDKRNYSSRKLYKPGPLQVAYLAAQADSQCFHSLPAKIQQKLFTKEEQLRYRQADYESVILDAADEAFYRWEQERQTRLYSSVSSDRTSTISRCSSIFSEPASPNHPDSAVEMDGSLHDSFRWLEEDGELDLTLDDYHTHIADTAAKQSSRRKPPFRRTVSFNSIHLGRQSTSSLAHQRFPSSSQSNTVPSALTNFRHRNSVSRPSSSQQQPAHAPRASTSSIDPGAQYYQDPEARLKLRVYLASPQKFDEAVEFGFPTLDNNENHRPRRDSEDPKAKAKSRSKSSSKKSNEFTGTFFDDDNDDGLSIFGDKKENDGPNPSRFSTALRDSRLWKFPSSPTLFDTPLPSKQPPSKAVPHRLPGNREMTLKMTLTRPDLRTDSPTVSPSTDDPLRLAELPPGDGSPYIWDDLDEAGMMKKMWRKFLKRKN